MADMADETVSRSVLVGAGVHAHDGGDPPFRYRRAHDLGDGSGEWAGDPHADIEWPRVTQTAALPAAADYADAEPLTDVMREAYELGHDLPKLIARRKHLWRIAWASGVPITRLARACEVTPVSIYRALQEAEMIGGRDSTRASK